MVDGTGSEITSITHSSDIDKQVYQNIRDTLFQARSKTIAVINSTMVETYWEIGKQIDEAIGRRAEYGHGLIAYLSTHLTTEFGKGFTERNLRAIRQFYVAFPIRHTLCAELSWSHYRLLMKIEDEMKRSFYTQECANATWSVRQLERQINSFYYERLLATQNARRDSVRKEIQILEPQTDPEHILKDPYVLEFLDLKENYTYYERDLEHALIGKIQEFLLELGKGFSFVKRQQRITSESGDHYYIDLVFYNYILKCFIIVDLKAGKLTYQDVGQLDFYVRLFDDKVKLEDDNPTIGIILCADKDESIVKYSVLAEKETLFAAKYMLYLPTEEELRHELERELKLIEMQR